MTEFSAVSLRIETVGDREALAALDALDRKGRQVVDNAAGAMGRAMGDVAVAYEKGGSKMRQALEDVAMAHRENVKEMEKQAAAAARTATAAERAAAREAAAAAALELRQTHSIATATRGLEMLGRTGVLTGRSLDAVVGQLSAMAFAFGPEGQLVAAVGITTAAIVEMFMRFSREADKAREAQEKLIIKMGEAANAGRPDDITAEMRKLQFGQPFDEKGKLVPGSQYAKGAFEGSLADLQGKLKALTDQFYATTNGFTQLAIQKQIIAVKAQLKPMEELMARLHEAATNVASQPADNEGKLATITTTASTGERAEKAAESLAKRQAKAYQTELTKDLKKATKLAVAQMVDNAETTYSAQNSVSKELTPDKKQLSDAMKFAIEQALEMVKNDPLLAKNKSIDDLAERLSQQFASSLKQGLIGAFETAFSGGGFEGGFKALAASVLGAFGSFLEQLGASMLLTGTFMKAFVVAMHNLNGPAMIVAGVGLIAAGAALKAVAGSFGGGSTGGGYSGASYTGGSGAAQIIDRGVIAVDGAYSSTNANSIKPRPQVTVNATIFGTNDASAQRGFDEMMRKSLQRGSLVPA